MHTKCVQVLRDVGSLKATLETLGSVGLVPTMGGLHRGHLACIEALRSAEVPRAVSIFVNPLQFSPGEDWQRYPRSLDADLALCEAAGVSLVFVPSVDALYPPGFETRVLPGRLGLRWEGACRPGHFEGVLTVLARLFGLIRPAIVAFGEKDFQQLRVVQRLAKDLSLGCSVLGVETVRDADGVALSTRNAYLKPSTRPVARRLVQALAAARASFADGTRSVPIIQSRVREVLGMQSVVPSLSGERSADGKIECLDYAAIVDPETLEPWPEDQVLSAEARCLIAAKVAGARLIDNAALGQGPDLATFV